MLEHHPCDSHMGQPHDYIIALQEIPLVSQKIAINTILQNHKGKSRAAKQGKSNRKAKSGNVKGSAYGSLARNGETDTAGVWEKKTDLPGI